MRFSQDSFLLRLANCARECAERLDRLFVRRVHVGGLAKFNPDERDRIRHGSTLLLDRRRLNSSSALYVPIDRPLQGVREKLFFLLTDIDGDFHSPPLSNSRSASTVA